MLSRFLFSIAFIVLLARSSHQASDGQVLQQWRRTWSVVPTQVVKTWKGNDPCRAVPAWFGISCNDLYTGRKTSRVTQISLVDDEGKDVKFAGQLPARLGMLSELQYMDWIDFPRLSGTVPPSIVNLKKLAVVYFYNTGLSGKLDVLGRIPNLREFWVDTNKFSGGLPKKLPASLERIGIYNEKLSGTWPKWTKLNRLLSVEFSGLSNVKGKWPASLSKLARLDEVVFRDTGLNGRLPNAKQLPKNMRYLRLPGNKMAGVLPKTWGAKNAMKKLVRVDLYSNTGLRGKVPRAWTRNAKMRSASLYLKPGNPRLCGVVPNKLKAFDYNSDRRMKNLGKC